MDKNIKRIRKSIEMRKKAKGLERVKRNGEEYLQSHVLPDVEESHGFYPTVSTLNSKSMVSKHSSFAAGFALKALLSVSLFLGVALITEVDKPFLEKPKEWTASALTNQFPFAKVNAWYTEVFGSPLSFRPETVNKELNTGQSVLPVSGTITENFAENGYGIHITSDGETNVSSVHSGVVVFAGNDRTTGKTVKVQHADGSISQYGFLDSIEVHLYQHISNSQVLGALEPESNQSVFFAIEKGNEYIDPEQVMLVDQQP